MALTVGVLGTILVHGGWRWIGAREVGTCQTNIARVGACVRAYAADWDGARPLATMPHTPGAPRSDWVARVGCERVQCPACRDKRGFASYALNMLEDNLSGVSEPTRTLLLADGNFAMDAPEDLACRHLNDGVVGCFVDGHVEYVPYARARFDGRLRLTNPAP